MIRMLLATATAMLALSSCSGEHATYEDIRSAAVNSVRDRLKSPSSATFAEFPDTARPYKTTDTTFKNAMVYGNGDCMVILISDSAAYISGEFESQNSYGAMLTGEYSGFMRNRGGGWEESFPLTIK